MKNIEKELSELKDRNSSMRAQWESEKNSIVELKATKQQIEDVKLQIERGGKKLRS